MSDLLKIIRNALWAMACVAFACAALSLAQSVTQDPKSGSVVALPGAPLATVDRGYIPPPVNGAPTGGIVGGPTVDPDITERQLDDQSTVCKRLVAADSVTVTEMPDGSLKSVPNSDRYTVPGFMDDEPVLYVRTSVWAAVSDYLWTLIPAQSCQEHETTVWYRVAALRLAQPDTDWDVVPVGMPFMSIRGSHG